MKTKIFILIIFNLFIFSLSCRHTSQVQSGSESELEAGIGIIDISGDSAVILDPLRVKAVVFKQGNVQAVLVECDVMEVSNEISSSARKEASQKSSIPYSNICIAATHTHMYLPHKDIKSAIVQAISDAQVALKPVKLSTALGQQFNVSFNRRYFMKDGSVVFNPMFLNPDIVRPVGPIDSEIGIILINDVSSSVPVASLLNFSLHLDIVKEYGAVYQDSGFGSRNMVSADFPYWIEKSLRKDFGSSFNSIFFTGCCGNINHWDFTKPGPQSGYIKSKEVGDSLYNSIKKALNHARIEEPTLAVRSTVIRVPLQSFTEKDLTWAMNIQSSSLSSKSEEPNERKQFLDNVKRKRILWLNEQKQRGITSIHLDVQVFRLSNNTAIVTLPGEMFVEYGLTIKNFSPFDNTFVVELANNNISYIPNKKAFKQGGYEVEDSRLIPGGGEMLVSAAIKMLNELKNDSY